VAAGRAEGGAVRGGMAELEGQQSRCEGNMVVRFPYHATYHAIGSNGKAHQPQGAASTKFSLFFNAYKVTSPHFFLPYADT
jgi:hypothetical protein